MILGILLIVVGVLLIKWGFDSMPEREDRENNE